MLELGDDRMGRTFQWGGMEVGSGTGPWEPNLGYRAVLLAGGSLTFWFYLVWYFSVLVNILSFILRYYKIIWK